MSTLRDVETLAAARWPDDPPLVQEALRTHFRDRPELLSTNLSLHLKGQAVTHVSWFVHYDSDERLLAAHAAFIAAVTERFGAPLDETPTTVAWRTPRGVLLESYAHTVDRFTPRPTQQLGLSYGDADDLTGTHVWVTAEPTDIDG